MRQTRASWRTRYPLEPMNARSEIPLLAAMKRIEMDLAEGRSQEAIEHARRPAREVQRMAAEPDRRQAEAAVPCARISTCAMTSERVTRCARRCARPAARIWSGRFSTAVAADQELMRTLHSNSAENRELRDYSRGSLGRDAKANPASREESAPQADSARRPKRSTERELEIVGMLSRVLTNKKIAQGARHLGRHRQVAHEEHQQQARRHQPRRSIGALPRPGPDRLTSGLHRRRRRSERAPLVPTAS